MEEEKIIEEESKDGKNIVIMLLVILGIFIVIFAGFRLYNNYFSEPDYISIDDLHDQNLDQKLPLEEGYVYKGYSFVKVDGLWWTKVRIDHRTINVPLHFGPKELEDINISGDLSYEFNNKGKVHIAIDPEVNYNRYYTLALMELNNNVAQGLNHEIIASCTKENYVCEERPIVNCDDTKGNAVIELRVANETKIVFNETCILIQGQGMDLVRASNRLIYYWYRVMN